MGGVVRSGSRVARGVVLALAAIVAGACDGLPALLPTPADPAAAGPVVPVDRPEPGPRDRAMMLLDPGRILDGVEGGDRCRAIGPHGSGGGDDRFSMVQGFSCPIVGADRTVWFLFADAWAAALLDAGISTGGGAFMGEVTDPLVESWDIRGDRMIGSSRAIGTNGPGNTLQLFVSLDLAIP